MCEVGAETMDCGQMLEDLKTMPSKFCPNSVDASSTFKKKIGETT